MIPLEAIARRLAIGSFTDRMPWEKETPPRRFHRLLTEYFLKTSHGGLVIKGKKYVEGLTPETDDPFIINPWEKTWKLFHPKEISYLPSSDLNRHIERDLVIDEDNLRLMDTYLRKVFLFLEGLFQVFGFRMADFKIEFGFTEDGELVIADVIDQDSWRLLTRDYSSYSKQAYRDNEALDEVVKKYLIIARMSEFFRIPKQLLVTWKGSESDTFEMPPEYFKGLPAGVDHIEEVISGHKAPVGSAQRLEQLMRDYPDGIAINCKVGRSNGLGHILKARCISPVTNVPADLAKSPHYVWSHLGAPSNVPVYTQLYDGNAVLAAMDHFAVKNPAVYMQRQFAIEELDRVH